MPCASTGARRSGWGACWPGRDSSREDQLVDILSKEHGLPSVTIEDHAIDPATLAMVPQHIARKYDVLPLGRVGNGLTLAMADPTNLVAMDEIAAMTRLSVLPVVSSGQAIRAAIERYYMRESAPMADVLAELANDTSQPSRCCRTTSSRRWATSSS